MVCKSALTLVKTEHSTFTCARAPTQRPLYVVVMACPRPLEEPTKAPQPDDPPVLLSNDRPIDSTAHRAVNLHHQSLYAACQLVCARIGASARPYAWCS